MSVVWIPIAVTAYFILAGVQIMDRFILRQTVTDPIVYVFAVGMATGLILPALPFIWIWPGAQIFFLALLSGSIFLMSLIPFFAALQEGEVSRVIPAVGGMTTVFTFILAAAFLGEALSPQALVAFALLFFGFVLVTHEGSAKTFFRTIDWRIVVSAILLAISFVLRRAIYPSDNFSLFISLFFMVTLGMTLTSASLLLIPKVRARILAARRKAKMKHVGLILVNQAGGAVSGFLINYAISIGPVTFVQATQGVQYVFIFLMTLFMSHWLPKYFKETFTAGVVQRKVIGTLGIVAGLAVLMLA